MLCPTCGRTGWERLGEDLKEFGTSFEQRREAAQKAGRWCRRIEGEAEFFMTKWHDAKKSRAVARHATVVTVTRKVDRWHQCGWGGEFCARD